MVEKRNQARNNQQVDKVMEEVGQELGVNEQETRSPREADKLAEQIKQEIRKRK